jgi:hypothetical protein
VSFVRTPLGPRFRGDDDILGRFRDGTLLSHRGQKRPSRAPRRTAQRPREFSSALSLGRFRAQLSFDRATQCIDVTRPDVARRWGFDPHGRGLGVDWCKLGGHGCSCFGLRIHRCSAKVESARLPQCVSFRRWVQENVRRWTLEGPQKKKSKRHANVAVDRRSHESARDARGQAKAAGRLCRCQKNLLLDGVHTG